MLRKLIVLAITSGLAKKAYDYYQENHGKAAAKPAGRKAPVRKTAAPRARASARPKA